MFMEKEEGKLTHTLNALSKNPVQQWLKCKKVKQSKTFFLSEI